MFGTNLRRSPPLPYTISFLRRIFERNIDEKYYVLIIQFMNGSKIYSTILP
jgi:hypothetical protein